MLALPLYDDTPIRRAPVVTYALIAGCAVVFLWQQSLGPWHRREAIYALGMIPAVLFGHAALPYRLQLVPAWATLLTSMFLHGGWLHLLGNMLYLWLFGRGVESALGAVRYLVFYLICGVAAALAQAAMSPAATVPMIGASGAIAGTLGAYLLLYPRGTVAVFVWIFLFIRVIAVPAVILLGLWFAIQLLSALSANSGEGGVAFWAHVGGFLVGMGLVTVFHRRGVRLLQPARSRPFSRSPRGRGSVPRAGRRRDPWG